MKKHLNSFLIAFAAILLLLVYLTNFNVNRHNYFYVSQPGEISDTMRYRDYKILKDSIELRQRWERQRVSAFGAPGEGSVAGFIGVKYMTECDTCTARLEPPDPSYAKYFLTLPGYYFKNEWEDGTGFFKKHNYYISSSSPRFAFVPETPNEAGSILIPISEKSYKKLHILVKILQGLMFLIVLYFVIVRPVRVLMNIVSGRAFDISNYQILLWTGWVMIIGSILIPVMSLLMSYWFRSSIPPEVKYFFWDALLNTRRIVIAGIAVLLLAYAFKRGHDLHEEQKQFV